MFLCGSRETVAHPFFFLPLLRLLPSLSEIGISRCVPLPQLRLPLLYNFCPSLSVLSIIFFIVWGLFYFLGFTSPTSFFKFPAFSLGPLFLRLLPRSNVPFLPPSSFSPVFLLISSSLLAYAGLSSGASLFRGLSF